MLQNKKIHNIFSRKYKISSQKLDFEIAYTIQTTISIDLAQKCTMDSITEDQNNWGTFGELDLFHISQCVNALRHRYRSQSTIALSPSDISSAAKHKDAGTEFTFSRQGIDTIQNNEKITNVAVIMFSNRNTSK